MKRRAWRASLVLCCALAPVGPAAWMVMHLLEPPPPPALPPPPVPVCEITTRSTAVRLPGRYLVAEIGRFHDELFAYLMYDYFRSAKTFRGAEVLLTHDDEDGRMVYPLFLYLPNDLVAATADLAGWEAEKWFPSFTLDAVDERVLFDRRYQTRAFVTAYNFPAYRKLERLTPQELVGYTERWVRFKSAIDARARKQLVPSAQPLDSDQAEQLAKDSVAVAGFYGLPFDFFLGIGAMENNYMNVKGDLGHAIWKRRPEKGDVVLKRRKGRVMVLNESIGLWQITRETLRYAHRLYLKDERDYTRLPEHLRPPRELNLDEIDPAVLTTYAGLLFRDLLDRFHGDIAKAVGAYNGGPGNPNMQYEEGVRMVAGYARRMMEQAAALRGQPVAEMRFLTSVRGK